MVSVSICSELQYSQPVQNYARLLAAWLGRGELSGLLGNNGQFERNSKAISSGIFKIHVRLPVDKPWPASQRQQSRTSNNYLIYAQHWDYRNYFHIIALISPDAHERAASVLPAVIKIVEEEFQCLNERELNSLLHVTG